MKPMTSILSSFRHLVTAAAWLALLTSARAFDTYHQFMQLQGDCPSSVWFQALSNGQPATSGHSGMLALGMEPIASPGFPPALWGAWFTWTPNGALLSYASGTIGSTVINDPSGAPITDVHGAAYLASALDVMVDSGTGNIFAATLYSGLYFWTPGHVYLLLVGGVPTVYEITNGGAPISGVRGISRLAAQVIDNGTPPLTINALLLSGALIYADTKLFLSRTFGSIATSELTVGGASIPMVRGVLAMGGDANMIMLASGSYFWTPSHVYQLVTGGSTTVSELMTPATPAAAITGTWGMTRQTRPWNGFGFFGGAATIFTPAKQYFTNTFGPIPVQEVLTPASSSIVSGVNVAGNHAMLHQSGGLMEVLALYSSPVGSQRGTVIGLGQ